MTISKIKNAMTVDVEDYFQVSAFEPVIDRKTWNSWPCRVEKNTDLILNLFDKGGVKATFFMLGWVAERYPGLAKKIVENGHELASHGYSHIRVTTQNSTEFRQDVERTKKLLEDIGGVAVKGYRAASYSIGANNLWALEVLKQAGYAYSSSIYPVKHDLYGMAHAPRFAFYPKGEHGVLEIPVTTIRVLNRNFPCGGGGFFRLYPYKLSRWALNHVNKSERQSGMFYFHPWEIDPSQPRPDKLGLKTRFRHYLNLSKMEKRLQTLMQDFQWDRMDKVFMNEISSCLKD